MAVIITPEEIKLYAPSVSGESDERIQLFIDEAALYLCEEKLGKWAKRAFMLYAIHNLLTGGSDGRGGRLSSETVGPLSRSYSADPNNSDKSIYGSTPYGRELLAILKRVRGFIISVV